MKEEKLAKAKVSGMIDKNVTVSVEIITPQQANEYLKKNNDNRKPSPKHVDWLAAQMEAGRWMLTHQGIAFDNKDHLRDGQHRLHAIIQSMTDQPMVVVRGLKDNTFTVMDTGKNRTASDVLYIEGFTQYSSELAASSRALLEWQNGAYRSVGKSTIRITNYMILRYAEKNKQLLEVIAKFKGLSQNHKGILNPTLAITFSWIFKDIKDCDLETALSFFERLYTGANLGEHSSELYLRNWLMQEKFQLNKHGKQAKMAIIIKGWNMFRTDKPVTKMWHWSPRDEPFPVPL